MCFFRQNICFAETNLCHLSQINALAVLRNLSELTIDETGNPVTEFNLWKPYVLFRLSHLSLQTINGCEVCIGHWSWLCFHISSMLRIFMVLLLHIITIQYILLVHIITIQYILHSMSLRFSISYYYISLRLTISYIICHCN